ncbi:hypothetical protein RDWZM_001850 [Blomia tropicalis]|uniref:Uncharacterized protein n=1 Tax=Blomia tropicalis TaxID=40697 RepID=A0A9Q0MCD7_BLOTA|nr:hypothetical protein RDWZM_001850 [Blomia tropicalis]
MTSSLPNVINFSEGSGEESSDSGFLNLGNEPIPSFLRIKFEQMFKERQAKRSSTPKLDKRKGSKTHSSPKLDRDKGSKESASPTNKVPKDGTHKKTSN